MSRPPSRAASREPDAEIGLGRRLARRLYPLALAIGVLISVGMPATEYVLESRGVPRVAAGHATELAARLREVLVEDATLSTPRPEAYAKALDEFLPGKSVLFVRVLDGTGRPVPAYEYVAAGSGAWWHLAPEVGSAPLVVSRRPIATVQVGLSRIGLLQVTALLLVLSTALAAILARLVYSLPVRVVTEMEGRIRDLIETLRRAHKESESLRAVAEQSARSLRDIVQDVDAIVWAAELPSGRFVFVSERAEAVLGYPIAQWTTEPNFWFTHLHPEDRASVPAILEAAARGKGDFEIEHRVIAADGHVVWLRNRLHLVRDAQGHVRQVRGVMVDITERKQAEDALKCSQEQYRSLVDNVKQVIFQTDARGRWTLLNPAWTELTGFTVEESLQRSFLDYVHPEDRTRHAELFQPLMTGETQCLGREVRYLTKAGGARWVEAYSRLSVDEQGQIVGTFGTLTDITERKRSEEELVAAQERLRHLLVSSPAVIHSREASGDFPVTFVGQNVTRLFGHEVEELVGDPYGWASLIHPSDTSRVLGSLGRIIADGQQSHEYRLRRRDGTYRWVHDEWRLVRDVTDKPVEIVGSLVDVTERKQGEEERARLSSAVEQSSESILISNPDGVIVYVNPAWERLTGYAAAEAVGQTPRILNSGKHEAELFRAMWATLGRGEPWVGHLVNRRKGGTTYEAEVAIFPVRDATGRLVNYVQLSRDVTKQKRMEEQMRQSQKMEAVGRLAGGVAHDFNNLLTVILGRCALVQRHLEPDSPLSQDMELVLKTGHRAAGLTRQLLAFSRKQVLTMSVLDLNGVVANMDKMLRRLIGEDVELIAVLAPGLGRVRADLGQIEQVIMNLVVNSRDAMPQGGRLTIETADVEADAGQRPPGVGAGPYVMLAVSDTGCGMDAEAMSRVFEPFFTTKGVDKGTGLGLSTVYGIVKQSGGEIAVESEPGRGTRFRIYLPRVEEAVEAFAPPAVGACSPAGQETVLLVEDDREVRRLIRQMLTMSGYHVLEADNGSEALLVAASHAGPIHLLITDVVMPKIGGGNLAQQIGELRPDTRILYMSGYTDDAIIRHGVLEAEASFLQKPFTAEALAAKVREILDRAPAEARPPAAAG